MGKTQEYTPTQGYLLVEPQEEKIGDLDIVKEDFPQRAKVVSVGKDTYYPNTDISFKSPCKVGDEIIHSASGFENIREGGVKKYRLVPFSNVLMVKNG